jgi:hypothetical protein
LKLEHFLEEAVNGGPVELIVGFEFIEDVFLGFQFFEDLLFLFQYLQGHAVQDFLPLQAVDFEDPENVGAGQDVAEERDEPAGGVEDVIDFQSFEVPAQLFEMFFD